MVSLDSVLPETTDTAPNSPTARAVQRMTPYSRPHLMLGSVTRQKVRQPEAPSDRAAISSSVPWDSIRGISARATNGNVTKTDASTIASGVKMTPVYDVHASGHQCSP